MAEHNIHHSIWKRSDYKTPSERAFREHKGLKTRMYVEGHCELHSKILPPTKLSAREMMGALSVLDSMPDIILNDSLATVRALADYLGQRSHREESVAVNLLKQAVYIEEFRVD